MLTKAEIKDIKEQHPNTKIKYMSSYGDEIGYKEHLCFIGAKYNPKANEIIFMADARKIK